MLLLLPFSRNLAESELYGLTIASTGTRVPAKSLVSNGVMRMAPKVDVSSLGQTAQRPHWQCTLRHWKTGEQEHLEQVRVGASELHQELISW